MACPRCDDRLQLGDHGRGPPLPLEAVEHGSPEAPLEEVGRVLIPDAGRDQFQGADHLVLIVERGTDEVPDPIPDQLLLDRGPVGARQEAVDDERATLDDRPTAGSMRGSRPPIS
jgi:hypothetical protein